MSVGSSDGARTLRAAHSVSATTASLVPPPRPPAAQAGVDALDSLSSDTASDSLDTDAEGAAGGVSGAAAPAVEGGGVGVEGTRGAAAASTSTGAPRGEFEESRRRRRAYEVAELTRVKREAKRAEDAAVAAVIAEVEAELERDEAALTGAPSRRRRDQVDGGAGDEAARGGTAAVGGDAWRAEVGGVWSSSSMTLDAWKMATGRRVLPATGDGGAPSGSAPSERSPASSLLGSIGGGIIPPDELQRMLKEGTRSGDYNGVDAEMDCPVEFEATDPYEAIDTRAEGASGADVEPQDDDVLALVGVRLADSSTPLLVPANAAARRRDKARTAASRRRERRKARRQRRTKESSGSPGAECADVAHADDVCVELTEEAGGAGAAPSGPEAAASNGSPSAVWRLVCASTDARARELAATGSDALGHGRWEDAEAAFTAAIALSPTSVRCLLGRSRARLMQASGAGSTQLLRAAADARLAVALSPKHQGAHYRLGVALFSAGHTYAARRAFEDGFRLVQGSKSARVSKLESRLRNGVNAAGADQSLRYWLREAQDQLTDCLLEAPELVLPRPDGQDGFVPRLVAMLAQDMLRDAGRAAMGELRALGDDVPEGCRDRLAVYLSRLLVRPNLVAAAELPRPGDGWWSDSDEEADARVRPYVVANVVAALVSSGAPAHTRGVGSLRSTPLCAAAFLDSPPLAEFLLDDGGVDGTARDAAGHTPLLVALALRRWRVAAVLVERCGRDVACTARSRGAAGVDVPLATGVAVALDATPLHLAAAGVQEALVRALLERGADARARDADGATPIVSLLRGHSGVAAASSAAMRAIVDSLVAAGATWSVDESQAFLRLCDARDVHPVLRRAVSALSPDAAACMAVSGPRALCAARDRLRVQLVPETTSTARERALRGSFALSAHELRAADDSAVATVGELLASAPPPVTCIRTPAQAEGGRRGASDGLLYALAAPDAAERLPLLPDVLRLDLSGQQLPVERFGSPPLLSWLLQRLAGLRELRMHGTAAAWVDDAQCCAVAESAPQLQVFDVSGSADAAVHLPLTDAGITALARGCHDLRTVLVGAADMLDVRHAGADGLSGTCVPELVKHAPRLVKLALRSRLRADSALDPPVVLSPEFADGGEASVLVACEGRPRPGAASPRRGGGTSPLRGVSGGDAARGGAAGAAGALSDLVAPLRLPEVDASMSSLTLDMTVSREWLADIVRGCTSLRSLSVHAAQLTDQDVGFLALACPALEHVALLRACHVSDDGLCSLVRACGKNLLSVAVTAQHPAQAASVTSETLLTVAQHCRRLERLLLQGAPRGFATTDALRELRTRCTALRELSLSGARGLDEHAVAELEAMPALKTLSLGWVDATSGGASALRRALQLRASTQSSAAEPPPFAQLERLELLLPATYPQWVVAGAGIPDEALLALAARRRARRGRDLASYGRVAVDHFDEDCGLAGALRDVIPRCADAGVSVAAHVPADASGGDVRSPRGSGALPRTHCGALRRLAAVCRAWLEANEHMEDVWADDEGRLEELQSYLGGGGGGA